MEQKTKIVKIDYLYYSYPEGITNIDELADFFNRSTVRFFKMTRLEQEHCVAPYFIEEESTVVYLNPACYHTFEEVEATVLSRKEYEERLREVVRTKCASCVNFVDNDDLSGHYEKLRLDGFCWSYSEKE